MTAPHTQCQPDIVATLRSHLVSFATMDAAADEIAALKSRVEEQDRLLAEAADFLNRASRLDAMDLGAVITAYRLKQQRSVGISLDKSGGAT
jgi:hypothetical protein